MSMAASATKWEKLKGRQRLFRNWDAFVHYPPMVWTCVSLCCTGRRVRANGDLTAEKSAGLGILRLFPGRHSVNEVQEAQRRAKNAREAELTGVMIFIEAHGGRNTGCRDPVPHFCLHCNTVLDLTSTGSFHCCSGLALFLWRACAGKGTSCHLMQVSHCLPDEILWLAVAYSVVRTRHGALIGRTFSKCFAAGVTQLRR